MQKTRNNHYVPQWYQKQFIEPGRDKIVYLDTKLPIKTTGDGRKIQLPSFFNSPTSRCFFETDLYSTFFGTSINDEIERKLFGEVDDLGAKAVRAYIGTDEMAWHQHFQAFFQYLDIQKVRTPKGLAWLRSQYPSLSQNELMREMQGVRNLNCTVWTQGVREIVSAEDADVKFIVTDHPVTIYNYAVPPGAPLTTYPNDPGIALKASQTIFPLSRDFCLILTNLEYAENPNGPPLEKRTFARNYRNSLVRPDNIIRSRKLNGLEVAQINHVLKSRARRYLAAGREEWLYPEALVTASWESLRETLLPKDELWRFRGEIYVKYKDGQVRYQDAFGRTEQARDFLIKPLPPGAPSPGDPCGCGSGQKYHCCCKGRPTALRPSWTEVSIRERNLILFRGITDILDLSSGKSWVDVRRSLTNEQIVRVYSLYELLWPLETDILQLLPKPDGRPRAVYTGLIHPEMIADFALGSTLYFGETIIEHPFAHAGVLNKEFSPLENPGQYHLEFLRSVLFFLNIIPLVEVGLVNLVPDPCLFDTHLRDQMLQMAQIRAAGMKTHPEEEVRLRELIKRDSQRYRLMAPAGHLASRLSAGTNFTSDDIKRTIHRLKEADPLIALVEGILSTDSADGQLQSIKLSPNFEMAMYIAQATGSVIVTDSPHRWQEIQNAIRPRFSPAVAHLKSVAAVVNAQEFLIPENVLDIIELKLDKSLDFAPELFWRLFSSLTRIADRKIKPNFEAYAAARIARDNKAAQTALKRRGIHGTLARLTCAVPAGGIQDNTVNRLLLMSSSEYHLPNVPMAFFIYPATASSVQKPAGTARPTDRAGGEAVFYRT